MARREGRGAPFAYDGLDRVIHEKARLGVLTSLMSHQKGLAVNDLKRQAGDAVASEFVGAAVSSDPAPDRLLQALPTNPQVRFFDNKAHGYLRAEVSAARMAVALRKVSDRRDREATVSTLKAYVVEEGARLATEA